MAFQVKLYNLSKRTNSTLTPSASAGTTYNCTLKGNCSILAPVLSFKFSDGAQHNIVSNGYNYAYIPTWGRYYHITNWTYSGQILVAQLAVDVLATYKTQIGNMRMYVDRSASKMDGNIIDSAYGTTTDAPTFTSNTFTTVINNYTNLTYVVGVVNKKASGGVTYYAMAESGLYNFISYLFNSIDWAGIDASEISTALQKGLINPFQYIHSIIALPVDPSNFSGQLVTDGNMSLGYWSTGMTGGILYDNANVTATYSVTIPKHPQSSDHGAYANVSPFSTYTLNFQPFGFINLDSTDLMGRDTLYIKLVIDAHTGASVAHLYVDDVTDPIRVLTANVAIQIPTANVNIDYANAWQTGLVTAGVSVAGVLAEKIGNYITKSATVNAFSYILNDDTGQYEFNANDTGTSGVSVTSELSSAIGNAVSSAMASMSKVEVIGTQGAVVFYKNLTNSITGKFLKIMDLDSDMRGYPYCKLDTINTFSGYVLCAEADISLAGATTDEKNAVATFMTSGFFYE